jgi:hypothetical protein
LASFRFVGQVDPSNIEGFSGEIVGNLARANGRTYSIAFFVQEVYHLGAQATIGTSYYDCLHGFLFVLK